MDQLKQRIVETNGIRMHIAEQGAGPLVILCHGFPEVWYAWKHQIPALAEAGFRVVAPDQRGYGRTDAPEAIEDYDMLKLTADMVGLVDALGEEKAVIIGHDWGAPVAWHCALLRPDVFYGLGLLSVPYRQGVWGSSKPTDRMKTMVDEKTEYYQLYFQEPGRVEEELEENVRDALLMMFYSASGDPAPDQHQRFIFNQGERFTDTGIVPDEIPAWLTEADLDFFTKEFEHSGFRGGVNWYRNMDRNWELSPFLNKAVIQQPALFVSGELDGITEIMREPFDDLEKTIPNLTKKVLIPGAGHWVQLERPDAVNRELITFLQGL